MCNKVRLSGLGRRLSLLVIAFGFAIAPTIVLGQAPAPRKIQDWDIDPYRNFLGTWRGMFTLNPKHDPNPILLTITEEKSTASMIWHYAFGVPGDKKYLEDVKTIVFSPDDATMLMHFARQPQTIYDVASLRTFQQVGFGTIVAVTHYEERNYWHVKQSVESSMTLELQANTLTYAWTVKKGDKSSPYSRVEFTRDPSIPGASPNP